MPANHIKPFPYQSQVQTLTKDFYAALAKLQNPDLKPLARQRAEGKVFSFTESSRLKRTLSVLDSSIDRAHQLDASLPRDAHCAHFAIINKAYLLFSAGRPDQAELELLKEIQSREESQQNPHGHLYLCLAVIYADTDRVDASISLLNDLLEDPDLEGFRDNNGKSVLDFLEMATETKSAQVTEEIKLLLKAQGANASL